MHVPLQFRLDSLPRLEFPKVTPEVSLEMLFGDNAVCVAFHHVLVHTINTRIHREQILLLRIVDYGFTAFINHY